MRSGWSITWLARNTHGGRSSRSRRPATNAAWSRPSIVRGRALSSSSAAVSGWRSRSQLRVSRTTSSARSPSSSVRHALRRPSGAVAVRPGTHSSRARPAATRRSCHGPSRSSSWTEAPPRHALRGHVVVVPHRHHRVRGVERLEVGVGPVLAVAGPVVRQRRARVGGLVGARAAEVVLVDVVTDVDDEVDVAVRQRPVDPEGARGVAPAGHHAEAEPIGIRSEGAGAADGRPGAVEGLEARSGRCSPDGRSVTSKRDRVVAAPPWRSGCRWPPAGRARGPRPR